MKIMTILGTRPEIIRLSLVIPALDQLSEHVLVHTGQNYDRTLYNFFFDDLKVRTPDYVLESKSQTPMSEIGKILTECEKVILKERPDRLLILGDTNSGLAAIIAKRIGIPVFHMEAGNRCYDDRVPEEVNRRIIDHSSDVLLPYTEQSRDNLLREGINAERIYVTGNPIREVLQHYSSQIETSHILGNLNLEEKKYFLITLHRAENVDVPERLSAFLEAFNLLHKEYALPLICSLHPRTRSQLTKQGKDFNGIGVIAVDPLGLFDFVHLEKNALCVLTDSGTVQEECCLFRVPTVTLRDVTERPETIEVGSNMLSGSAPDSILSCVKTVLNQPLNWNPPLEYLVENVRNTIVKILLGYTWK